MPGKNGVNPWWTAGTITLGTRAQDIENDIENDLENAMGDATLKRL
jgi:hypothetical protein